jgi:hypothetical protein
MAESARESQSDRAPSEDRRGDEPGAPTPSRPTSLPSEKVRANRNAVVLDDPTSFSMWGLLCVVSGASLVLAVGTYFPKPVFAGAVGIATLVTMVALSAMRDPPAVLQLAWWTLLLIYLMAIGSAVLG